MLHPFNWFNATKLLGGSSHYNVGSLGHLEVPGDLTEFGILHAYVQIQQNEPSSHFPFIWAKHRIIPAAQHLHCCGLWGGEHQPPFLQLGTMLLSGKRENVPLHLELSWFSETLTHFLAKPTLLQQQTELVSFQAISLVRQEDVGIQTLPSRCCCVHKV